MNSYFILPLHISFLSLLIITSELITKGNVADC